MSGRVNTKGRPGDHRPAPLRQPRGKIGGHGRAIRSGRARPYDRHRPLTQLAKVPISVHPQSKRLARFGAGIGSAHVAEHAQHGRPLLVTWAEQPPAEVVQQAQVPYRIDSGIPEPQISPDRRRSAAGNLNADLWLVRPDRACQSDPRQPLTVDSHCDRPGRRRSRAIPSCVGPGHATPARSASVQAIRRTRSRPRAVS